MPLSNQGFEYGVHQLINGVISSGDFDYGVFPFLYGQGNIVPPAAVALQPVSGRRYPTVPSFIFTIPPEATGEPLHFKLEVAINSTFSTIAYTFDTRDSTDGWTYQVSTDGGTIYGTSQPVPADGIPSVAGELYKVTYNPSVSFAGNTTYYWRVLAFDGHDYSLSYTTNVMVIGDRIIINFNSPVNTGSVYAKNIIAVVAYTLATDGAVPASIKVYATNNGFDANPVWEDITNAVLTRNSYAFVNTTKTANDYGVTIRVELYANDSIGPVEFRGCGFNFN